MFYNINTLVELHDGKRITIYTPSQPKPKLTAEELREVLEREHRYVAFDKIIRQEAY